MIDLTLKPTTYKAVRIAEGVYSELVEMFGDNLVTTEENFSCGSDIGVIIQDEHILVPTEPGFIIVAEYVDGNLSGVFVADSVEDLHRMFDWEGEL